MGSPPTAHQSLITFKHEKDGPGGQREKGHAVVLHDPGEGYQNLQL